MDRLRRGAWWIAAVALLTPVTRAEQFVRIPIRVEPPQAIRAVTLTSRGEPHSCEARDGTLLVPANLPLPWSVGLVRFEQTSYTRSDLERNHPLVLRELGEIRVRFHPAPPLGESVRALVLRNGETVAIETSLTRIEAGLYRAPMSSGVYAAAFASGTQATRIRPGVVISPGATTDAGDLALEPTGSATVRVLDDRTKRPIVGANVTWSPADGLNADVARLLFRKAWSTTTDRNGIAVFRTIGPPPVPARWSVQAAGYAPAMTPRALIADTQRVVLGDTSLRPEMDLIVVAELPRDVDVFRDSLLVLSEPEGEDSRRYRAISRQRLRERENKVRLSRIGQLRFSIESKNGRKLFYQDVEIGPSDTRIVLTPLPIDITGAVRRADHGVEGVLVTAADGHDARTIVGQAHTDLNGAYKLTTYQAGDVLLYTNGPHENGAATEPVLKNVRLNGERELRVDFELPSAGIAFLVVDAESGLPLKARVQGQLIQTTGMSRGLFAETDDQGRATIAGVPEGTATVFVRSDGHRGRELSIAVGDAPAENKIALEKGDAFSGRVIDSRGVPIAGARILGGYATPLTEQPLFQATTDSTGSFDIPDAPPPGTTFYAIARGYAVAATSLHDAQENLVRLSPPNAGTVTLVEENAPPALLSLFLPAPRGGEVIPYDVFRELGAANGMSPFQLLSSGKDGTLILPEFLAPGTYTLYVVRPTGKRNGEQYVKVVDLKIPSPPGVVIAMPR